MTKTQYVSNGDVRKALNSLEVAFIATPPNKDKKIHISLDTAVQATQKKAMRYDRDGDSHYDILSAFQKSIRGSDPDAAVYYLARMLYAGESVTFIARFAEHLPQTFGYFGRGYRTCISTGYIGRESLC